MSIYTWNNDLPKIRYNQDIFKAGYHVVIPLDEIHYKSAPPDEHCMFSRASRNVSLASE